MHSSLHSMHATRTLHYVSLRYIASHCVKLHDFALNVITFALHVHYPCITFAIHYITGVFFLGHLCCLFACSSLRVFIETGPVLWVHVSWIGRLCRCRLIWMLRCANLSARQNCSENWVKASAASVSCRLGEFYKCVWHSHLLFTQVHINMYIYIFK